MRERRKFVRIKEEDGLTYSRIPDYKEAHDASRDISAGGIRFHTQEFVPLHSVLRVTIKLEHNLQRINAVAKVVWVKEMFGDGNYEVGAEFVEIAAADLKFLEAYISQTMR